MGLAPNPANNPPATDRPLQVDALGEALRDLAGVEPDSLRPSKDTTEISAAVAKSHKDCAATALQIYDFLYVQLEPYVGSFYSDRVSFGNLDKELSRLLRTITYASILEEGDDRIYMEGLMRSVTRCQHRAGEILEQLTEIGALLKPNEVKQLSDVLDAMSAPVSTASTSLPTNSVDVREAVDQIRAFVVNNEKVAAKVRRFAVALGSSNVRNIVEAELETMRLRGVKVQQSLIEAHMPALLIAGAFAILAAGAAYMMSITPWWRPFTLWLLIFPIGVFLLATAVRRWRDEEKVNLIRKPFASVLFGASAKKVEIGRTSNNKKIFAYDFLLYEALRKREFLSSPREYWEHSFPLPSDRWDVKTLERDFLSLLGRDPYNQEERSARGQGRSRPRGLVSAFRNSALPFLISTTTGFISALFILTLLGGRFFPFWQGWRGFEEPLAPMDSSLVAALIGAGPNGGECVLATGSIFWDGDLINIRPLHSSTDQRPRSNELQTVARSAVRRIVYERVTDPKDFGRAPAEAVALPSCLSSPWAFTMPGVGLVLPAAPMLPPVAIVVNGEPVRMPQRTVILPFFSNPVKPATIQAVFDGSAQNSSSSALIPYMNILAQALDNCAAKEDVVMDVIGFASDKDIDSTRSKEDNMNLNHALAEGRRRMVLNLMKQVNNPHLLIRNLETNGSPQRIFDLDLEAGWPAWSKQQGAMRFDTFEQMIARRDAVAKAAVHGGTAIQELFARSVVVEFESLGDCD